MIQITQLDQIIRGEFKDRYENNCSIQNSSLATEPAIWFGIDNNRMHLTQEQVKELLPFLIEFAEKGEINFKI